MGKLAGLERSKGWVEAVAAAMMGDDDDIREEGGSGYHDIIAVVSFSLSLSLSAGVIHVSEPRKGWMDVFVHHLPISIISWSLSHSHTHGRPGTVEPSLGPCRRLELSRE